MDNKQIQEDRMRGYFIDSAKNLIKGEGLRSISVRHVADHAGYSYATLYNYFKDINELLFRCVEDFCREAEDFVEMKTGKMPSGYGRLKATAKAYTEYFTEYPGVFELFFLEKMGNFGNKRETAELITGLLDRLCEKQWEASVSAGELTAQKAEDMRSQLGYLLPGMLLFYENRLSPDNYTDFMNEVDRQIGLILG